MSDVNDMLQSMNKEIINRYGEIAVYPYEY